MNPTTEDVVRVARSYMDTPYHHMGRIPGVILDCAGVLICVGRELQVVSSNFDVPVYSPMPDGRSMIEWCDQFMGPKVEEADMKAGYALIVAAESRPQHIGILGNYVHGGLSIIHSSTRAVPMRVIETRLMFSRNMKFVACYKLPGVEG